MAMERGSGGVVNLEGIGGMREGRGVKCECNAEKANCLGIMRVSGHGRHKRLHFPFPRAHFILLNFGSELNE